MNKKVYPERLALDRVEWSRRGFTLIEILIASVILAMVFGATALVEKQSLGSGSYNQHKLQAVGLAQEGINLTRSIRDTNLLKGDPAWTNLIGTDPAISYMLEPDGTGWKLVTVGTQTISINGVDYTRYIYVED